MRWLASTARLSASQPATTFLQMINSRTCLHVWWYLFLENCSEARCVCSCGYCSWHFDTKRRYCKMSYLSDCIMLVEETGCCKFLCIEWKPCRCEKGGKTSKTTEFPRRLWKTQNKNIRSLMLSKNSWMNLTWCAKRSTSSMLAFPCRVIAYSYSSSWRIIYNICVAYFSTVPSTRSQLPAPLPWSLRMLEKWESNRLTNALARRYFIGIMILLLPFYDSIAAAASKLCKNRLTTIAEELFS